MMTFRRASFSVSGWRWLVLAVACATGSGGLPRGWGAEIPNPTATVLTGVVIDRCVPWSGLFIGSPSLMVLPTGEYIAAHDGFSCGTTPDSTVLFASKDHGRTWTPRGEVRGQQESTLFVHRKVLYLMGTSEENGAVVIRRSTDAGHTWTTPQDATTGRLLAGGKYHTASVPVVFYQGRVWRGMEVSPGSGEKFGAFMLSAPVGADLLQATNWTCSSPLSGNGTWLGGRFGDWLDGNAVPAPDGQLVDVLRVASSGFPDRAAIVSISTDGRRASFDPTNDFIHFPGGRYKFTIRYDQKSQCYWTLANSEQPLADGSGRRSQPLTLLSSPDLRRWTVKSVLVPAADSANLVLQAADWQFDKNDLVMVCRTGPDPAAEGGTATDADELTYHQLKNFRTLGTKNSGVTRPDTVTP